MRLPEAQDLLTKALADYAPGYSIIRMQEIDGSDPNDWIVYSAGNNFGVSIEKDGAQIVLGRRHDPRPRSPDSDGPALPSDFLESYRDGRPDDVQRFLNTYVLRQ